MSRRKEREKLFKIIFQEYVNPNSYMLTDEDSEYVRDNFIAIRDNIKTIEKNVIKNITRWHDNEIGLVEKILLIIAFHELETLDHRIVANEAIELSKKYGNEHSGKFINGILGNIINSVKGIETIEVKEDVQVEESIEVKEARAEIEAEEARKVKGIKEAIETRKALKATKIKELITKGVFLRKIEVVKEEIEEDAEVSSNIEDTGDIDNKAESTKTNSVENIDKQGD